MLVAERLMRQLYWSWPALRRWRRRKDRQRRPVPQECDRDELREHLRSIGVTSGALVLLHTRITGVRINRKGSAERQGLLDTPRMLLSDLCDLVGPTGTLVMPTNVKYQMDALEESPSNSKVHTYDPSKTPSSVGLVNEFFWRMKGVKRSLFPFNMLAAYGPLADELLRDNLNERKPSPHGVDSGYYRICQRNGLVVSIGVALKDRLTLANVVEEVREDWHIKNFFADRQYQVVQNGQAKVWVVRRPRDAYGKFCHCRRKMGRDIIAEGVIHEGMVGTLRVDWARAGEIFDFFWRKTADRPYPYYGLWLAGL